MRQVFTHSIFFGLLLALAAVSLLPSAAIANDVHSTDSRSNWVLCGSIPPTPDLGSAEGVCDAADMAIQPAGNAFVSCGWQKDAFNHYDRKYYWSPRNDANPCGGDDNLFESCQLSGGELDSDYDGWCLQPFGNLICLRPQVLDSSKAHCVNPNELNPPPGCPQRCGDPVDPGSGNVSEEATDYRGTGPFPLVFSRAYNGAIAIETSSPYLANTNENMGKGWSTNIGAHLNISAYSPSVLTAPCVVNGVQYFCPAEFVPGGDYTIEVTVWHADGTTEQFQTLGTGGMKPAVGTVFSPEAAASGQLAFVNLPSPMTGAGYSYLRPDAYTEYYDAGGGLLAIVDPRGLMQTFQRSDTGYLASITDPAGRKLKFAYDSANRIHTVTNPAGGVYTYTYDSNGNLSTVTYPDNSEVQYKYQNTSFVNALTSIIDEDGNTYASWSYDSQGRAISTQQGGGISESYSFTYNTDGSTDVTEPTGELRHVTFSTVAYAKLIASSSVPCTQCAEPSQSISYDPSGYVSSRTDFDNNITNYTHDAYGNETSRTEAYGTAQQRTITTQWNLSLQQPTLITEPGRTTGYTYDGAGHVLTKTVTDTATSVARTTTYTYYTSGAATGLLDTVTDPMSNVTTYGYDSLGDLNSVTNAANQVTQVTQFDGNGLPLTTVDPNGVTTTLVYDQRQRLTSETVNTTEVTQFGYDSAGNLTKVTLPDSSYLQYGYDAAHRLTSITDKLGDKISYTLDNLGNRTQENTYNPSSTLTKTLQRTYNTLNQLATLVGGMGQTTTFTDDLVGNTTSVKDPLTNVTGQTFDALNRLVQVTDPNSGVSGYSYDPLDRVQGVTDPRSLGTSYSYDAFGDVTQQVSPDTGTTAYTYDLDGNRLTKTDANGITATYAYDALNRLTSVTYPDSSKDVTYSYDSGTDGKGRLTGITDASGTTSYSYDAWGNVTGKTVVEGGHSFSVAYSYDLANRLKSITYPDTTAVTYTRDTAGRITAVSENSASVVSSVAYEPFGPIAGLTYGNGLAETRSYDLDYRLTGISVTGVQGLSFGYNADDDITSITDSITSANSQTLGYDVLNRLTSASGAYGSLDYTYDADGNRTQLTLGSATTTYTLDTSDNRLASLSGAQTATYSYDSNGNLLGDGTHVYGFDDTNRLGSVDSGSTASYVYNGLGQRVEKTVGSTSSVFVYDEAGHLLGEYDSSGNRIQQHIWLEDRPIAVLTSAGLDYVQTDQLNTPRAITNSSQAVAWSLNSDPFDNGSPIGSLTYNLRFPGQYYDAETGHNYNYERDYDPNTGRYTESDPIGLNGGANTYAYAGVNPITFIDPTGTDWGTSMSLTWQWLSGTGPDSQTFGPGSSPAGEMQNAPGVQAALNLYNQKNQNQGCDCKNAQPVTNFASHFGLSGLFKAGLNPTEQFVGSYRVDIYPMPGCKKKIVITNTSSFRSFAYGIAPDWNRSSFGPMGNMSQTIWWIQ